MTESQSLVERLAGEAGFVVDDCGLSPKSPLDGVAYVGEYPCGEMLAKFAELVARECMSAVKDEALADACNTADDIAYNNSVCDCADAIRQRFGVGE